ncbi:acyltransferase [Azospirillum sp. B506]|uniref:acyltransferase family protein n=1 Tax=Azospirillum sp. B506 TaxID=137721 RepID=UPI0009FCC7A3|nr:acyltransferase [Azospirillum sp. B506]
MMAVLVGPGIFRFFLAAIVFAHHMSRLSLGTSAVYVFFSLSGFWIFRMWENKYSNTESPYFTYIVSRSWRIIPNFAIITWSVVAFELFYLGEKLDAIFSSPMKEFHFIFSQTFALFYCNLPFLPVVPAWSLDMEMQFYVVAPLMIIAFKRISHIYILVPLAVVAALTAMGVDSYVLPKFLVFFAVGMSAAARNWRPNNGIALISGVAAMTFVLGIIFSPWHGILLGGAHPEPVYVWNGLANVIVALLIIPYAIFTTTMRGGRFDGALADLSFIVYLIHWGGTEWFSHIEGGFRERLVPAMGVWVSVIVLSIIVWKVWDTGINRARSAWVSSRLVSRDSIGRRQVDEGSAVKEQA